MDHPGSINAGGSRERADVRRATGAREHSRPFAGPAGEATAPVRGSTE